MLIKGGDGPEEELAIGEGNEREGEHQEEEKHDRGTGESKNKEEHQIRSKRKAGVFFGLNPSSNARWDTELEKEVDGGKAWVHKNGFELKNHKRRVLRRVRTRVGKTDKRGNRTREKDWNTLPDIWMTLGKQVQSCISCFSKLFDLFVCLLPSQRSSGQCR